MSTLRFTAGLGMPGACGLRLVWRARTPLPCAHRSSAKSSGAFIRSSTEDSLPPLCAHWDVARYAGPSLLTTPPYSCYQLVNMICRSLVMSPASHTDTRRLVSLSLARPTRVVCLDLSDGSTLLELGFLRHRFAPFQILAGSLFPTSTCPQCTRSSGLCSSLLRPAIDRSTAGASAIWKCA